MELSEKIRILRKIKGWSQEELGYKLSKTCANGISRQAVSDWENGKSEPKLDNIRDLANILGVSFDVLLDKEIDLNNKDTLNRVLLRTDNENLNDVKTSISYDITVSSNLCIKKITILIIDLIVLLIGIVLLVLYFHEDNFLFYIIGIILTSISSVSFFISLIPVLTEIIRKDGVTVANLNHKILTIYNYGDTKTTLYVPIETIENIEAEGKHLKFRGTLIIKFKNKVVNIHKVYKPLETIETYQYIKEHFGK